MSVSYVLIGCEFGTEKSVMNSLEKNRFSQRCSRVMGSYDIIVKLEEPSLDDLKNIISSKICTIDKVRMTLTLPTIESQE
jgi:DNA-binding Lrp family transcriptional regulator